MAAWVELIVRGEDSAARAVRFRARLLRSGKRVASAAADPATGEARFGGLAAGAYTVEATGPRGTLPAEAKVELRDGINRVVIVFGAKGEPFYYARGSRIYFQPDRRTFLLLARGAGAGDSLAALAAELKLETARLPTGRPGGVAALAHAADIGLFRVTLPTAVEGAGAASIVAGLQRRLRKDKLEVSAALIIRRGDTPESGLGNELLVGFAPDISPARVRVIAKGAGLKVVRPLAGSANAFLLSLPGPPSYGLLKIAATLAATRGVRYAEPNLLLQAASHTVAPNDVLWPRLTQLRLIGCGAAWEAGGFGSDRISIAVIDDGGVAPDHPDLSGALPSGSPKLTISYDFVNHAPQRVGKLGAFPDHGTQCAGAATALVNNRRGIVGVAPGCRLIGARIPFPAFEAEWTAIWCWAAGLGPSPPGFPPLPQPPADVIVNAWGPDGAYVMSQHVDDVFTAITSEGRGGLGSVLVFSIGNNGYAPFAVTRPWAADPRTIAVGASINADPMSPVNSADADPSGNFNGIDVAADTRALYSPYGDELDLVAPSNSSAQPVDATLNDPITAAVRVGTGDLNGCRGRPGCLDYAASFGGTSHATALVGGAAALVLSVNPALRSAEIRDILCRTARRIDTANSDPIGRWVDRDGDGAEEFSQWYGYGRIDVARAVAAATAPLPAPKGRRRK